MIDETDIVTYRSENAPREDLIWCAYVVLPNGNYWGVRFNGSTKEEVINKAISLWDSERLKYSKPDYVQMIGRIDRKAATDPWADVRAEQHHMAGKVWMIHTETREKKRVPLTEISLYEKNGYVRGGPRSK